MNDPLLLLPDAAAAAAGVVDPVHDPGFVHAAAAGLVLLDYTEMLHVVQQ